MKTTHTIIAAAFCACTSLMSSCNGSAGKADNNATEQAPAQEAKIAYVEIDSIMTKYQFCIDAQKELEQKGQNTQQHIEQKGRQLQAAATKFQQDLQNNKYTQQQAQNVQANLQKQDNDLQMLQQRLAAEFQTATEDFNQALRDSIQHFLDIYNKDKRHTFILSKAGDNMLYADPAYDITEEVIAGLNKSYKPGKKAATKAADTSKEKK